MKKPKFMSEIYAFIFSLLGFLFIVFAILSLMGIVKPTAQSLVQDPKVLGLSFFVIGIASGLTVVGCQIITLKNAKLYQSLFESGAKVTAKVERVSFKKGITFGRRSPFVVYYSYTHDGNMMKGKSCLLWEKPNVSSGNSIEIWIDLNGNSMLTPNFHEMTQL